MAPVQPATRPTSGVPRLSAEELTESNRELAELLDSWERDGDEQEQRQTLSALREALGERHFPSSRNPSP